eukprot:gene10160-7114_t
MRLSITRVLRSAFRPVRLDHFVRRNSTAQRGADAAFSNATPRVVVSSNSNNIHENLATEEALLRGVVLEKGEGMLMLYVNTPCVVVGRNQNILSEVSMRRATAEGIRVARRSSGGGAVFHDTGNLCLSFFTHRTDYAPEKTIQILRAALSAAFGLEPSRLTTTRRHDLFLDEKKITGSAMRVQRDIAFHHCTLLLSSCREALGRYLQPEATTVHFHTAAVSSVRSPVTTIQSEVTNAPVEAVPGGLSLLRVPLFSEFVGLFYQVFGGHVMESGELPVNAPAVADFVSQWKAGQAGDDAAPLHLLDVQEAMQSFQFVDGEGRPPSKDVSTLSEEVRRCAALDWLWSMPKFETVIRISASELQAALLRPSVVESVPATLWQCCLAAADGELLAQDIVDELLQFVFPSSSTVLLVRSMVQQRKVVEAEVLAAEAEIVLTLQKETSTGWFNAAPYSAAPFLTALVRSVIHDQNADATRTAEELKSCVQPLVNTPECGLDLPEPCQVSSAALLSDAILRVWKEKNNFDFARVPAAAGTSKASILSFFSRLLFGSTPPSDPMLLAARSTSLGGARRGAAATFGAGRQCIAVGSPASAAIVCPCAAMCGAARPASLRRSEAVAAPFLSAPHRSLHSSAVHRMPPPGVGGGAAAMYQCGECGKSFRLLNALNHHIMTKHAGNAKAMVMKDGKLEPVGAAAAASAKSTPAGAPPNGAPPNPSVSAAGMAFPGMPIGGAPFGGVGSSTQPPTAPSSGAAAGSETEPGEAADDDKKSAFVCTICQKTFRLEAALQHHYQAKHNMSAPNTAAGTESKNPASAADGTAGTAGGTNVGVADDATQAPVNAAEYLRQQEGDLPSAPQYHLDVAPNAPDESDIAVHWRCVNLCVLMGIISDIQVGYVFEDHVLQFTLATHFEAPSPGDPDRDFHLVRVYDEKYWGPLKDSFKDGDVVLVNGRLRLVPQYDATLRKYYHHPVVQVFPDCGLGEARPSCHTEMIHTMLCDTAL